MMDADSASLLDGVATNARFNFARHLIELNAGRPAKTAYIDDDRSLTYGDLADRLRRLAATLLALGVRREERVLLLMQDCCDWPVCFLGCLYAGIVPVAVNTQLSVDDYGYMLRQSRAQAVLVSGSLLPVLRATMAMAEHEVTSVLVSHPVLPLSDGMFDIEILLDQYRPLAESAATGPDDPGFWLYSSGSTGRAKGTLHSQIAPYWTARLYGLGVLGLTERDICFSTAKLFFAYGLGNALSFPLSAGATVILMAERPTPNSVFKRWSGHKTTVFFGVPTGYAGLLAAPDLPRRLDVALRLCCSAGEALPEQIGRRFSEHFGCDVLDGIGSTEMLHIFLSNRPGEVRYGTTGRPVEGYRIELRREDGTPVEDGEIGDLFVEGPSAALMYCGDPAKSRETFQGVWTKTGDKYRRNMDGTYSYIGRVDDLMKVSGLFVSPFEVENTLLAHPAVLEAAVVGAADQDGLTKAKAFVVVKPQMRVSDTELKLFVQHRLAPFKCPRQIEFVDDLPKTATGKIQRFKLRALQAAQ
jgi:benzoate-CoA ligase